MISLESKMSSFDANLRFGKSIKYDWTDFSKHVNTEKAAIDEDRNQGNINEEDYKDDVKELERRVARKLDEVVLEAYLKKADELPFFLLSNLRIPLSRDSKGTLYSFLADALFDANHSIQQLRLYEDLQNLFRAVSRGISSPDLSRFPNSCFLTFQFALAKPLLSKDDDPFHFLENPIRQDWVFKLPVFEASSWKGCLNSAVTMRIGREKVENKLALRQAKLRLFGSEKDFGELENGYWDDLAIFPKELREDFASYQRNTCSAEGFRAGRLHFFPTFFDAISLEVLNPHDRNKRAGKNPVWLESVPAGQAGTFQVLYFPFDLVGKPLDTEGKKEIVYDLQTLMQAIYDTFRVIGFGAKHLSGYGRARNDLQAGRLYFSIGQSRELNLFDDVKTQAENGRFGF